MFLWRACSNALPTKVNLCRRGCKIDPICVLCGEGDETVDHLLWNCSQTSLIWYGSALRIDSKINTTKTFKDLFWTSLMRDPNEVVTLMAYITWKIWKGRNLRCFENKPFKVLDIISRSHRQWKEYYEQFQPKKKKTTTGTGQHGWIAPERGMSKLNCDVAVGREGSIGCGFVVRDEHGKVILAGKQEEFAKGSSTILEARAMRHALQTLQRYGMTTDSVECDSSTLIDGIQGKGASEVYCAVLIKEIRMLAKAVHCETFNFISRSCNQVAHHAARGPKFIAIKHDPAHLCSLLVMDVSL